MALYHVKAVRISFFYCADSFSAAQSRLEPGFSKYIIGVFTESSERIGECIGGNACDIGYLLLQPGYITCEKFSVLAVAFRFFLGNTVAGVIGVAVV